MNTTELVNAILEARNASTAAYERMLPIIQAFDPAKIRTLNAEVPAVSARVLGAAPRILAHRAEIAKHVPTIDISRLERLEDEACALQEAHVRCLSATKTPDELRALAEEGDKLRSTLRSDAAALINRGLIDPARLSTCNGQPGYKVIATELGVLATVLLSSWTQIAGKCCVSEQELHRAKAIADALLAYVGIREQSPEEKAAALVVRDRAFSLLAEDYELARRAITFLRWEEGDADQLAPSLYGTKHRSRKEQGDDDEEEAPANAGSATPPANPPATPANGPSTPSNSPAATPGNGSANPSPNNGVGRPNSNPFMQ